jgi:plastocyanin
MKLKVFAANIAKVVLAGLVVALFNAFITQAIAETNTSVPRSMLTVKGHVSVSHADAAEAVSDGAGGVVVWLVPAETNRKDRRSSIESPHYKIVQRDKTFVPHLLVVPVGSTVEFPNNDPWLHNVFSISRGIQFDLGLYGAGVLRSVRFDRPGVSYLFCSIHPEMMAVVVTVDSTYFGVSNKGGRIAIDKVPYGQYFLHAWQESAAPQALAVARRRVFVGDDHQNLPTIVVSVSRSKANDRQELDLEVDDLSKRALGYEVAKRRQPGNFVLGDRSAP